MDHQLPEPHLRRAHELVHVLAVALLDFRLADVDALLDVLAPDFLDEHAFEELLLQLFDVGSLKLHLPNELGFVGKVHFRDGRFLPFVEVAVGNPESALVGDLQDQGVVHHPFENLQPKGGLDLGVIGDAEALALDDYLPLQLAEGDHVPVDERHHPVHHLDPARAAVLCGRHRAKRAQHRNERSSREGTRHGQASKTQARILMWLPSRRRVTPPSAATRRRESSGCQCARGWGGVPEAQEGAPGPVRPLPGAKL